MALARASTGSFASTIDVFTGSGAGWRRGVVVLCALAGVALAGQGWRVLYVALAATAVVTEAATGHAAAASHPLLLTASFAIHLAAVGVWLFAIVAAVATRPTSPMLAALAVPALAAAVIVAGTGTANAALELNSAHDLVSTQYGNLILIKAAVLVAMATAGLLHARARRQRSAPETSVRRPLRVELILADSALLAASLLVATPNPPREAEAAERALAAASDVLGATAQPALALADGSGPFVVGLSVVPPRPGVVQLRVLVVGAEAGDGLRDAQVTAQGPSGSRRFTLLPCGFGCFHTTARLETAGAWTCAVSLASNRAPIAVSFAAPLPTPDGRNDLQRALAGMETLRSAKMHEVLRGSTSGGSPTVSDYGFVAPDRFAATIGDIRRIVIGAQAFERDPGGSAWQASSFGAPGFRWPADYYREFWADAAAVSLLGTETVDGAPTQVVSFVRADLPAWFRLYIDADGRVRRQEMRAEGHLMDQDYTAFDQPLSVEPPG